VIKSFQCKITEKLWHGEPLKRKDINKFGNLNWECALETLETLNSANEKNLLTFQSLSYHSLHDGRYSVDVKARGNWRIIFNWDNEEKTDVCLVRISDETH